MDTDNYARFERLNKSLFKNKLPKIKIVLKKSSRDIEATFTFDLWDAAVTHFVIYGTVNDKVIIHEMIHYFLYMKYIYKKMDQKQKDWIGFYKFVAKINKIKHKVTHTKEFWKIYRQKVKMYESLLLRK